MSIAKNIAYGAAGAVALNATHESARQLYPKAPHIDLVAMSALGRPLRKWGHAPENVGTLRKLTMAGDLISNAGYYAWVIAGHEKRSSAANWQRALGLGIFAGAVVVIAPPLVGLDPKPVRRTPATALMTVLWYTIGALVATGAATAETRRQSNRTASAIPGTGRI